MASEHLLNSDSCERVRRGFLVDISVIFMMNTICAGGYLAGLLRYTEVSDSLIGLITAVPVIAGVFQVAGATVLSMLPNRKRAVGLGIALHRTMMALIFLIPVLLGSSVASRILVIAAYSIGHFANAFVTPEFSTLLVRVTPNEIRSSYLSLRERYGLVFAAISSIVASFVLDNLGIRGLQQLSFLIIGGLLLASAIVNIIAVWRMEMPTNLPVARPSLAMIATPLRDRGYRKVVLLLILWQVTHQLWAPFTGVYLIKDMGASYTLLGIVGVICSFEKALLVRSWGRLVSRTSWETAITAAMVIYGLSTAMFIWISPANVLWFYPLHSIVANIAWSFIGIGLFNIQCKYVDSDDKSMHLGVCAAINGLLGFGAAMGATVVYEAVNRAGWLLNGQQVLVVAGLVVCSVMITLLLTAFRRPATN